MGRRDLEILDVGCGNGWLGHVLSSFGHVSGIDLSMEATTDGTRRYPELNLICGDFMKESLHGPFDLLVSADAFAHMDDHEACIHRFATLLRTSGTLLLMTQNPYVWARRSRLSPLPPSVPHSHPDEWPSLGRIRQLLQPWFRIVRTTSLDPGGDRGLLWWVENRYVRGVAGRALGRQQWRRLLETAGLGRELVVVALRK
jgi:SAM-dependent methyltransferase